MDFLAQDPIQLLFDDIKVTLPHPANFALQKLLIAERRKQKGKAEKDRAQAVSVLTALDGAGEFHIARALYQSMPKSWQRTIEQELTTQDEHNLLVLLKED